MKRINAVLLLLAVILICVVGIGTNSYAQYSLSLPNKVDGFRAFKFGSEIATFGELTLDSKDGDYKGYTKPYDNMDFAGCKLDKIFYVFYKDKFLSVEAKTTGWNNYIKMDKHIKDILGTTSTCVSHQSNDAIFHECQSEPLEDAFVSFKWFYLKKDDTAKFIIHTYIQSLEILYLSIKANDGEAPVSR